MSCPTGILTLPLPQTGGPAQGIRKEVNPLVLKKSKLFPVAIGAIALIALLAACNGGDSADPTATPTPAEGAPTVTEVSLRNFAFEPSRFNIEAGTTVEFRLKSRDIEHTFTVKDLDVNWFVQSGITATESFTFDRPGEYRLICAIAGHEQAGMVGVIRVQ